MYFSIIVPVYNTERYLNKCIESIVNQAFKDLELILVDDGSTDKSGEICDEWARRDNRIKVIHKKNAGVSAARNTGLQLAKGEYIAFVDSDDTVKSNWLEKIYETNKGKNADIISFGMATVLKDEIIETAFVEDFFAKSKLEFSKHFNAFSRSLLNSIWSKAFKAALILDNDIKFDETVKINEDVFFNYDIVACANSFLNISDIFYFYNRYDNSSSAKGHKNFVEISQKRVVLYKEFMRKMGYSVDENTINEILRYGIFAQYLQAATSTNLFTLKDRFEILKKLYKSKEQRAVLLEEINKQPKNAAFALGKISVKCKMPFVIAVPTGIKKILGGKK